MRPHPRFSMRSQADASRSDHHARNAAHGRDLSEVLPQLGEEWLLHHKQP